MGRARRERCASAARPGTGKSHFVEALGQLAVDAGLTVAWFTLEALRRWSAATAPTTRVTRAIGRLIRADLIVVDDIGLLPVARTPPRRSYRLVDAAYERRSLAVSSNLHPAGFDELMPKTLATATVDRTPDRAVPSRHTRQRTSSRTS